MKEEGTYYIVEEPLRTYGFERTRETVEMSEPTIPDMIPRSPKRFWDSLLLFIGAIDKLGVMSFDAFAS